MKTDPIFLIEYDGETYKNKVWTKVRKYFRKDKMSVNTAVAYLSIEAAERALTQAGRYLNNVRIVQAAPVAVYEQREDDVWYPVT